MVVFWLMHSPGDRKVSSSISHSGRIFQTNWCQGQLSLKKKKKAARTGARCYLKCCNDLEMWRHQHARPLYGLQMLRDLDEIRYYIQFIKLHCFYSCMRLFLLQTQHIKMYKYYIAISTNRTKDAANADVFHFCFSLIPVMYSARKARYILPFTLGGYAKPNIGSMTSGKHYNRIVLGKLYKEPKFVSETLFEYEKCCY